MFVHISRLKKCTAALDQLKNHKEVADFSSEQKLDMYNEIEIIDGYSDQENETTEHIIMPKNVVDEIFPDNCKISIQDNEPIDNIIIPKDLEDENLSDDGKISFFDHNKSHINLTQQDINLNQKMVENQL